MRRRPTQHQYYRKGHGEVPAEVVGVAEGGKDLSRKRAQVPGDEVPGGAVGFGVMELDEPIDHDHSAAPEGQGPESPANRSSISNASATVIITTAKAARRVQTVV